MASSVEKIREAQRASGTATILAIGTATPPTVFEQADYPDFYFRATKSEHKTELKEKLQRICERSTIKKRHMYVTEEILEKHPNLYSQTVPSFDVRRNIFTVEVPKLGKEAALKAIKEWGRPISEITHLVFSTSSDAVEMPGADYNLLKLIGLRPNVRRFILYNHGCYAGGSALRLAKDLAENNAGARVLVVCSENMAICFSGPSEEHVDMLVGQAIFGDGAAAVIVGADTKTNGNEERPLFQMVWTDQSLIPQSEGALCGYVGETGPVYTLSKDIPSLVGGNIELGLKEALGPMGVRDWNSMFYVIHPGGPAVLNQVEEKLGLDPKKLKASREVLVNYGNMWGATLIFVLDEMRKNSVAEGKSTTGEGMDWGLLVGFGPGMTLETIVLKSVAI
jgi:chalcone synthase